MVVIGITGAIDDDTPIGSLVLPEQVVNGADGSIYRPTPLRVGHAYGTMWTTNELLTDRAVHADLRSRGVVSLDMETAAVAKVYDQRGVAWSVVRAISDRAGDGSVDAEIAGLTHSDGTVNLAAVVRSTWSGIAMRSPVWFGSPKDQILRPDRLRTPQSWP